MDSGCNTQSPTHTFFLMTLPDITKLDNFCWAFQKNLIFVFFAGFELRSPDYQEKVLCTTPVKDHHFLTIWADLYVAVRHTWSKLSQKLSRLWKGRALEDALLGEKGGAVKPECQECGKAWLRPEGGWEQRKWGGGGGHVAVCNRSCWGHHCKGWCFGDDWHEHGLNSDLQITKKRWYPLHWWGTTNS
jgi:hypothetical protein